ncbi:MAG: hypothetical protein QN183_06365 [Armatimonadota bacterium]|nr:hypothetical protein [Armatimonadota bacterium]MDR7532040.1 hypothetical protein [Armatimonadota bacterium]MDR7535971.1 hypothetical protein [Armatimonadota bacterium]
MGRWFSLVVALVLVGASVVPASAATNIQLRFWPTSDSTIVGVTWNSAVWGVTLRRDFGTSWAASFSFDHGGITNWTGAPLGTDSYNRFWSVNLHRTYQTERAMYSVYAGYGGTAWEAPSFPAHVRQTAFRLGADVTFSLRERWFLVGDVGYTPGQGAEALNYAVGGTVSGSATLLDYRVGIAYRINNWGLEVGYRGIDWNLSAAMCGGITPCFLRWGGVYVGANFTTP